MLVDLTQALGKLDRELRSRSTSSLPQFTRRFGYLYLETSRSGDLHVRIFGPFFYDDVEQMEEATELSVRTIGWVFCWDIDLAKLRERLKNWGGEFADLHRGCVVVRRGVGESETIIQSEWARRAYHEIKNYLMWLEQEWEKTIEEEKKDGE